MEREAEFAVCAPAECLYGNVQHQNRTANSLQERWGVTLPCLRYCDAIHASGSVDRLNEDVRVRLLTTIIPGTILSCKAVWCTYLLAALLYHYNSRMRVANSWTPSMSAKLSKGRSPCAISQDALLLVVMVGWRCSGANSYDSREKQRWFALLVLLFSVRIKSDTFRLAVQIQGSRLATISA
jgi:hypothetical protein